MRAGGDIWYLMHELGCVGVESGSNCYRVRIESRIRTQLDGIFAGIEPMIHWHELELWEPGQAFLIHVIALGSKEAGQFVEFYWARLSRRFS